MKAFLVLMGAGVERTDARGVAIWRFPAGSHVVVATRVGSLPDSASVVVAAGTDTAITIPLRSQGDPLVAAERRLGRYRVFMNLENLGDVRMTNHQPLARPVRGEGGRWTMDAWAPLEGRVINGGVRIDVGRSSD